MKKIDLKMWLFLLGALLCLYYLPRAFAAQSVDESSSENADKVEHVSGMNDGSDLLNGGAEVDSEAGVASEGVNNVKAVGGAGGMIKMQSEDLDGDILKISVVASGVQKPVLGLSFDLQYDGKNLAFLRYQPGDFLEKGGDPFYLVKPNKGGSALIFGETLRRNDKFPLGGGKVAEFYFQILSKSELKFGFKNGVVSTLDTVRQDIDKIDWQYLVIGSEAANLENPAQIQANSFGFLNFGLGFVAAMVFAMVGMGVFWLILRLKRHGFKHTIQPVNFK